MNSIRSIILAVATVVCTAISAQKSIQSEVCWIDGNLAAAQTAAPSIDISTLVPGLHSFSIRVQDNEGLWSSPVTKYFVVPLDIPEKATAITEREYWIDNDVASRTALGTSPAQISLVELSQGLHSLTVRVKTDAGVWSATETKYFIIPSQNGQEVTTIARYMYWFDGDMENVVSGTLDEADGMLPVFIGRMTVGEHTLTWSVADSKDAWSEPQTESFTLTTANDITTTFAEDQNNGASWYTVGGQKLDKVPTAPGVYIRNGKKVIVK